ncbi:hypothetical protein [Bailinhaonella thermotolerans]|uniref:hypothetical protein n=1 Tax=Bailinhaonella thermotolerans TaxID=1070861 RepID=UPI001F5BEB48|nr:hypothetical protein [Bailinhaonella thermotolerans]
MMHPQGGSHAWHERVERDRPFREGFTEPKDFGAQRRGRRKLWTAVAAAAIAVAVTTTVMVILMRNDEPARKPVVAASPKPTTPAPVTIEPQPGYTNDYVAGVTYKEPQGAGWKDFKEYPEFRGGWTGGKLMRVEDRPGSRNDLYAIALTKPVPESQAKVYPELRDLRSLGVLLSNEIASLYFPAPHQKTDLGNGVGALGGGKGLAWVFKFKVDYPEASKEHGWRAKGAVCAVTVIHRGEGKRPAMFVVAVPDNMDISIVDKLAAEAGPLGA